MTNRIFYDTEIKWFYGIEVGVVGFVLLLSLIGSDRIYALIPLVVLLGFLYISWPLHATVEPDGAIIFKYPLRKVRFSSSTPFKVKAIGVHDYRAHIALRAKWGIPVGYRCRKYTNAPELAQAVLDLVDSSSSVKVTDDAMKLLRQVAKGSRRPLSS